MNTGLHERQLNRAFLALLAAFFVNFLGYAFIVPILPSWQTQFDLNATQATMLVSLWAVPLLLLGPFTGRITDRFGAGPTVLVSLVLLAASSGLYILATNEWVNRPFLLLAGARMLHGASGATIMTAGLASASILWPVRFGEQAGKLLGMAAIGGLLGPVLGGVLFSWGEASAFVVLGGLTLMVCPLMAISTSVVGGPNEHTTASVSLRVFFDDRILFRVGVLLAITTLATGALEAGVPLFLDDALGLSAAQIGGVLLVMVLMQGLGSVIWGRWVDRNGPTRYMLIGWLFVSLALLGVGLVGQVLTGTAAVLAMIVLLGTFQFFIAAAQLPMLPMIDPAPRRALGEGNPGLAFGVFGAAWAAGTILGPLLVGPMFDAFSSWALALGCLCVPALGALAMTYGNQDVLHECYAEEIQKRIEQLDALDE
ncbi:MAG TPA: MFS transporter [Candidatus Poseidoniales archaeon]|nr:MAG TPA: MFS transporter [Candidatus Poseidoniales archaeon]HII19715.1 MFS transporter [Poseidonia sp.]